MYQIDFTKPVHVHFIGIGGISMSGFAKLFHHKGFTVSGSDLRSSKLTQSLEDAGIPVKIGQHASNITQDIAFAVYTAAVKPDNPEYQAAQEAGIPLLERAELVGQLMLQYHHAISISGTHGKTTTTAMLSMILLEAGHNPTISVGSILTALQENIHIGEQEYFVVESCEYSNSFLKFHPTHEIILNIEEDHLDFFKDLNAIRDSFHIFAKKLPKDGVLVIHHEIEQYCDLVKNLPCQIITYGLTKSQISSGYPCYFSDQITFDEFGFGSYDLWTEKTFLGRIKLNVTGLHNISNSIAAATMAFALGVPIEDIQKGLFAFTGTERRFEKKGELLGVTIIDDYAHHPNEMRVTLQTARQFHPKRLFCAFQPHTYSRTKRFLHEMAEALAMADTIVLTDIYAAREKDPGDISSLDLEHLLKTKYGKDVYYFSSFQEAEIFLLQNCTNGDMLITMGAGDVVSIGESLLGE